VRPAPILTEANQEYWKAAVEGRLAIQQCGACGRLQHPPEPMCPMCQSTQRQTVDVSGHGVVYSYTLLHHPQHPAFDYPVIAALVDLDEGVRVLANLVDVVPHDVRIGMAVTVEFRPTADDLAVPVFRPVGDA
jgi:uncharacterized OB-fold protein